MTLIETLNSTYEIDYDANRIRRVKGVNPPTSHFAPDGEWHEFQRVFHDGGTLWVFWTDGSFTRTSTVKEPSEL